MANPRQNPPSPPITEKDLLSDLSESLQGYQSEASYCLGGSIPISTEPLQHFSAIAPMTCPPVTVRFDANSPSDPVFRVTLPVAENKSRKHQAIGDLLKACKPATFGLGGKDVLDEVSSSSIPKCLTRCDRISVTQPISSFMLSKIGVIRP